MKLYTEAVGDKTLLKWTYRRNQQKRIMAETGDFLADAVITEDEKGYVASYDISGTTPLADLLGEPLSRDGLTNLLEMITAGVKGLMAEAVDPDSLLMDPDYIYVGEGQKLTFLQIPVTDMVKPAYTFSGLLKTCFGDIRIMEGCSTCYGDLMAMVNGREAEPADVETMLAGWAKADEACVADEPVPIETVPAEAAPAEPIPEEVVPVVPAPAAPVKTAQVCRLATGETRVLGEGTLTIGKQKDDVDWFIDNRAVSRHHADIEFDVDAYFLVDNNATNHTFLNGVMLASGGSKPLHDGDRFVLGNEEFLFQIF